MADFIFFNFGYLALVIGGLEYVSDAWIYRTWWRRWSSWRLKFLAVPVIAGTGWLVEPLAVGWVLLGSQVSLISLPIGLQHRASRLESRSRFKRAAGFAQLATILHPDELWRNHTRVLRAPMLEDGACFWQVRRTQTSA